MPSGDTLLTTREAATRLGITPGRVRQLILAGQLRAEKIGRDLLITEAALENYQPRPVGRPSRENPTHGAPQH